MNSFDPKGPQDCNINERLTSLNHYKSRLDRNAERSKDISENVQKYLECVSVRIRNEIEILSRKLAKRERSKSRAKSKVRNSSESVKNVKTAQEKGDIGLGTNVTPPSNNAAQVPSENAENKATASKLETNDGPQFEACKENVSPDSSQNHAASKILANQTTKDKVSHVQEKAVNVKDNAILNAKSMLVHNL